MKGNLKKKEIGIWS